MLRLSLQGNIFYGAGPLMGLWEGVQKTPKRAGYLTVDERGMRDCISA